MYLIFDYFLFIGGACLWAGSPAIQEKQLPKYQKVVIKKKRIGLLICQLQLIP